MTRIALVGDPDWPGADLARRALTALLPEAEVRQLPVGATPTADLDGVWLLAPPMGGDPAVHDLTLTWARQLALPVVGPLGADDGGTTLVSAVPGSRWAASLGPAPLDLPAHESGARRGAEYVAPAGTVWFAEAHRGEAPAAVTAGGTPFVTLVDHPLATEAGLHPLLVEFAGAARGHRDARLQAAAPAPAPPVAPGPIPLAPLPDDEPRSYVHQMRTGDFRGWRYLQPLLALALGVLTFAVIAFVLSIAWVVLDPSLLESGGDPEELDLVAPLPMLINNLILAALIPATLVATRVGHWRPVGKLWSVAGRMRWGWLFRASLVTLVVWGAYLGISVAAFDTEGVGGDRPDHWQWLIVITLITTPLQAAGEEVAFRGGLLQGIGAWVKNPVVALVLGTVLSTALFALAHTSLDPWILLDLGAMAAACCYLTWRTGGLEAAIALHVVNNLVIIILLTVIGGLEGAYVTEDTTSTAGSAGISAFSTLVMTAILLWLARRSGIAPKKLGAPALSERPAPIDPATHPGAP